MEIELVLSHRKLASSTQTALGLKPKLVDWL
jgi:hypothetical protein